MSMTTLCITIPMLLMVVYLGEKQFQIKKSEIAIQAMELAKRFGEKHEDVIMHARTMLETLATQPDLLKRDPILLRKQFQNLIASNPQYASLTLAGADGYLLASSADDNPSFNYRDRDAFKVVMREGRFTVSETLVGLASKQAILPFSAPVKTQEGLVSGVLLMGLKIDEYVQYFTKLNMPEGFRFLLFNDQGTRLLRFPQRELSPPGQKMIHGGWEIITEQNQDTGNFEIIDQTGKMMTYAYIKFFPKDGGKNYLGVLVGIPSPGWFTLFWPIFGQAMLLILVTTTIAFIINHFLSRRIVTTGVEKLSYGAKQIAKREWTAQFQDLIGSREIMELGASFIDMHNSLIQAEQALLTESTRLKVLLETSIDGVHVLDPQGNLILCSPSFARMLGYTIEESAHLHVTDWDVQIPNQKLIGFVQKLIKTPCTFKTRHRCKDGSILDVEVQARSVQLDGKTLLYNSSRDVTKRKITEKALRESESRIRSITDSAQDAILMMDPDQTISFWNPAAERLFGYAKEEALGLDLHKLLAPGRYLQAFHENFHHFLHAGCGNVVGKVMELTALRKDGAEINISLSLSALKIQGQWHAIGIIRDVTELRRLEQIKQDVERIVRHDLMGPLAGIINVPQLLLEDPNLFSEQREMLGMIHIAGKKMLRQINNSFELYKIESGSYRLKVQPCDPLKLVADNIDLLTRGTHFPLDAVCVRNHTKDQTGQTASLATDELLLDIIFMNLLRNALEASSHGSKIYIDLLQENGIFSFTISNSKAVPPNMRERFFEKYTTFGKRSGTGLGTYSAAVMTQALGGTIEMVTSDDTGTQVTVRLPNTA